MNEMLLLQESMTLALKELEYQKYSQNSMKAYSTIYHSLQNFMEANRITVFNEKVCIEFIFYRTGYRVEGFYGGTGNQKVNSVMKPLQVLLDFIKTGIVKFKMRPKIPAFQCPEQFEEE